MDNLQDAKDRVSRQTLLKEIGEAGRERLAKSHVVCIGAGGLGSPVILYLAAAGVGHITVIDDDVVSVSNLSRQILHSTAEVDQLKVKSAERFVARLTPHTTITPKALRANVEELTEIVRGADLLIDASDNLATRIVANRASQATKVPLLFGSAIRWSGQVGIFDPTLANGACFECLFEADDANNDVKAVAVGVASTVTGVIGTLMACEAMKKLVGLPQTLTNKLLMVDALTMDFQTIQLMRNPTCTHHH